MRAIITVVGKDQVGIIASVCGEISQRNVNVLDISQTILQGYFTMVMLVDVAACNASFDELKAALKRLGEEVGVTVHVQHESIFQAMHRI